MKVRLQDQIDAAVNARTTICLGLAPLKNPSADYKGGTLRRMHDGTINYVPPNDRLNS